MYSSSSIWTIGLIWVITLAGCGASRVPSSSQAPVAEAPNRPAVKRIMVAIQSDSPVLERRITVALEPGLDAVEDLINPGLATNDRNGKLVPRLAEAIPSVENGLWMLLSDGRMETTWRIREGARWHDGTPVTAEDVLFTARVEQDKDLTLVRNVAYASVENIQAAHARTIVVQWKQPFIEADALFERGLLPAHLLAQSFAANKGTFTQLPYWSRELVGAGPFKVREWVRGSHLLLDANDQYVLGRPKIDVIEVRLIPDQNALFASILAGTVELTLGKSITLEQALDLRSRWTDGRVEATPANAIQMYPQFLNPNPPIVAEAQFRRALITAVDRQTMVDTLMGGLSAVAHSFLRPDEAAEYQAVESSVVKYEYDPRRSIQMIEELGYRRDAQGVFRGGSGDPLTIEIRTITTDINEKAMYATADTWQQIGVRAEPYVIPRARAQDREYRATFPAFELVRNPSDRSGLKDLFSSQTPLPENNFSARNRSRYMNAEFDSLLSRYFATIPIQERAAAFGQILRHMTDQLTVMGMFYDSEPTVMSNRLVNVTSRHVTSTQAWNAHEWDVE